MNKYYIMINFHIHNNQKIIDNYVLYKGNKIIDVIGENNTINDIHNTKINIINNNYIIKDIDFIKKHFHLPSKKISHKNINVNKVALISTAAILSLTALAHGNTRKNDKNETSETIYYYATKDNPEYETPNINVQFTIDNENNDIKPEDISNTNDEKHIIKQEDIYNLGNENIKDDKISKYTFDYEDRTSSENVNQVIRLYSDSIKENAVKYGIDEKLIKAIISQENPENDLNDSNYGGHGIMQIESIWNNQVIRAYNFDTNCIEEITIDTNRANTDTNYCIKIGCMIFSNYYNYLNDTFGNKLDDETLLVASLFAYNKGITQVSNSLIINVFNLEYFLGDIKNSSGGDNNYDEHVLSFISDQVISIKDKNGNIKHFLVDNVQKKGNQL